MGWLTLRLLREAGDRAFIILCAGIAIFGVSLDLAHFISPMTRWFSAGSSWTLIGLFFSGAALRLLQNKVVVSKTITLCMTLSPQGPNPVWRGWMGVSTGQVRYRQRTVRLELRIDTIVCSKLQDIDTPFPVSAA